MHRVLQVRQRDALGDAPPLIVAFTWYTLYTHECAAHIGHCPLMRYGGDLDTEFGQPVHELSLIHI